MVGVVPGRGERRRRDELHVLIVVVLQADELERQRHVRDLRVGVRHLHRPAVLRHLREVLADQRGVRGAAVGHLGLVVDVAAETRQRVPSRYSTSVCMPRIRVLPRFCFCAAAAGPRRSRIRLAGIVTFETGSSTRLSNQVRRAVTLRAGATLTPSFAADQPLGAELVVGTRRDRADRELAIQLGQRRRAESGVGRAPRGDAIGHVVQRGDARADDGVGPCRAATAGCWPSAGRSRTVVSRLWPS